MEIILGEYALSAPGGAQTYALTLADHLQRIGHGVTLFTLEDGGFADHAREQGLRVVGRAELPDVCDAIVVQDGACAYELAERFPTVPQAFVMHSAEFEVELPPQVAGIAGAVLVMNDRVEGRARAMALDAEIVRLRQPIDPMRFRARRHARERPRTAVLLGNALAGPRRDLITGALEAAGISWTQLGASGSGMTYEPERALGEADIVVGYGRAVLEGMSCGCAAYVYDLGLDGWVTDESYAAIEADGFAGLATAAVATPERIAADLARYTPALGVAARELVSLHHSAYHHTNAVVGVLARLAPTVHPPEAADELARLVRVQWQRERVALQTTRGQHDQIEELRRWVDSLHDEVAKLTGDLEIAHAALAELHGVPAPRAPAARRRYRLADAVLRPLDLLRTRLRSRG